MHLWARSSVWIERQPSNSLFRMFKSAGEKKFLLGKLRVVGSNTDGALEVP